MPLKLSFVGIKIKTKMFVKAFCIQAQRVYHVFDKSSLENNPLVSQGHTFVTSTSYFSVRFKNTTFWMMEGKLLCSGDSLGLADLSDKAN